eukprot:1856435-Amphidinium_carterae.1
MMWELCCLGRCEEGYVHEELSWKLLLPSNDRPDRVSLRQYRSSGSDSVKIEFPILSNKNFLS